MINKLAGTAMGIALLLAPAASAEPPWDPHQEMLKDCFHADMSQADDSVAHRRLFEAQIDNTCDESVRFDGTAQLWVDGRVVAVSRLDDRGRAHLRHEESGMRANLVACVDVAAEQVQSCRHRNSDAPGHAHHQVRFPLSEMLCGQYE